MFCGVVRGPEDTKCPSCGAVLEGIDASLKQEMSRDREALRKIGWWN